MNNIIYTNSNEMSKILRYNQAKILNRDLGYDDKLITSKYRKETKEYFNNKVKELAKEIKNRNNNYNRVINYADKYNLKINYKRTPRKTNNALWVRELRRLRMITRRKPQIIADLKSKQNEIKNKQNEIIKNIYDDWIKKNMFQKVFTYLIKGMGTLTINQARKMYEKIMNMGKYNIKMTIEGGKIQNIPINPNTRKYIIDILTNGFIESSKNEYGSDILNGIDIKTITSILLIKYQKPNKIIKNKNGAFFPYLNTTDLDLTKYQIYTQNEANNLKSRENCFIECLLQNGVDECVVNNIKLTFKCTSYFKKKDIKRVAEMIKCDIILYEMRKDDGRSNKTLFKGGNKKVEIAIYQNHYFVYEKTIYSKYFIDNYEKLKNRSDRCDIINVRNNTSKDKKINSLLMCKKLLDNGYFVKLDMSNFAEMTTKKETKQYIYLDNIENEQREIEVKDDKANDKKIFYADCEAFVYKGKHELYLLGVVDDDDDYVNILNVENECYDDEEDRTQTLVYDFLKIVSKNGKQNALVYFHNLKYDYHLLEKYLNITSVCDKDNQIYNVIINYKKIEIELRDSFKLIPFALGKFGKEFDLPMEYRKKEAIAYNYYTHANNDKRIEINEYLKLLSVDDKKIFLKQIENDETYDKLTKTFNPTSYYIDYLKLDCLVLKKGLQTFNKLINVITKNKMDIYDCLTISSLTDKYFKKCGCYDDVYEVKGNLRAYIAKAVYGGRVNVNEKYVKKVIEKKISDFDGVSLYPSAINRLCREIGLPTGEAVRFKSDDLKNWNKKIYAIMTIKILKVNKTQQMPFIAYKTETSIDYTNEARNEEMVIDSITLNDYIKFHKIEYELIDGVYWNDKTNKKMGEIIKELFVSRLEAKANKKITLSNVIKLMLNSAYGKTIMKQTFTEKKMVKRITTKYNKTSKKWEENDKNIDAYIYNNFNTIKSFRDVNENIVEIESICIDDTYNRGHIGCAVLSMSKRIMNEVFDVANQEKSPIYYTDTDSLHMDFADVNKLNLAYFMKYKKQLIGLDLEQFHTDFDLDGADSEIYAIKSIFLGKKSYYDKLECINKNGDVIRGSHIRLKGITPEGLEHEAKKYENGYEGLYEDLAYENEIDFILNPFNEEQNKKKVLFEFKDGKVSTKKEFRRKVRF